MLQQLSQTMVHVSPVRNFGTFDSEMEFTISTPHSPIQQPMNWQSAVRIFKEELKKTKEGTISDKVAHFFFAYKTIPQSTTGTSLTKLMLGRRLQSQLDFLRPSTEARVECSHQRQKRGHNQQTQYWHFAQQRWHSIYLQLWPIRNLISYLIPFPNSLVLCHIWMTLLM